MTNQQIIKNIALDTLQLESKSILDLSNIIDSNFCDIIDTLRECQGKIVLTGIGKSAIIGMKISATLNSTGSKSIFLHLGDALHGDMGVIGKEDDEVLRPTLKEIYDQGTLIYGPYAADSFFGTTLPQQFDAVLATYHDQGLIPFKTLTFGNGVNFTAGLSKVRTSPDHGTAFDIAGKGVVSTDSFEEAMLMARKIFFNRQSFEEATHQDYK